MVWTRLDDQFWQHPKVIGLSNAAFRLYVSALNWSVTHLQDGHVIPVTVAIALPQATKKQRESAASELVTGGLWYANGSGWVIHDFADYQESSEDVAARRDIWRRKQSMRRDPELSKALKARDKNKCRYCGEPVDWKDRKGQLGGTYDHVVPLSDGGDDSIENLVVACRGCNTKKGNRSPEESGLTLRQIPARKSGGNQGGIKTVSGHPIPIPLEASNDASQKAVLEGVQKKWMPPPLSAVRSGDPKWTYLSTTNTQRVSTDIYLSLLTVPVGTRKPTYPRSFPLNRRPNQAISEAISDGIRNSSASRRLNSLTRRLTNHP